MSVHQQPAPGSMTGGSTKTQTPPAVSMTEEDKELSGTPRQGHGGLPCEPDGETVEATATLCGTQKAVKRPGNCPRRTGIERQRRCTMGNKDRRQHGRTNVGSACETIKRAIKRTAKSE